MGERRGKKKERKRRREGNHELREGEQAQGGDDRFSSRERDWKKKMERQKKAPPEPEGDPSANSHAMSHSGRPPTQPGCDQAPPVVSSTTVLRKRVEPELANYFYQIANLFESSEVDLEEKTSVCGSAMEETRGEELALATDVVLSRTLQTLLEGCDFDALSKFVVSCATVFSAMAADKCGSHVAETALKSLIAHLEDPSYRSEIESILKTISEAIIRDAAAVMSSPYGSHVLRSLVCLCKGVSVDSLEDYHVTKRSLVLAERLNLKHSELKGRRPDPVRHGFPDLFRFLVFGMLRQSKDEISSLRASKYSSFVMQTVLKLLHGDEEDLMNAILLILGCPEGGGDFQISADLALEMAEMLEDTASCHLLEVIIEMAPESLFDEILRQVFKGSFEKISMHYCGNFAVQALLASVKSSDQLELIWEELHPLLKQLLETGKTGVIASLLAACHRLQTRGRECCHALANALCPGSEFPNAIVPRMLFLERNWAGGEERMNIIGCLMLQIVFRFPKKLVQPFIRSVLSMDAHLLAQAARDAGGTRVLEAFLSSDSSAQQKTKVIGKLQGYFGELSLNASSSFMVEKCFEAGDLPIKSAIASELLGVKPELSKKKHGAYIIKKLDIDGFESRPEQWTRRQANRENTYREFHAAFGPGGNRKRGGGGSLSSSARRRSGGDDTLKTTKDLTERERGDKFMESVEASVAEFEVRQGRGEERNRRRSAASKFSGPGRSKAGSSYGSSESEKIPFLRQQRR